MIHTPSTVPPVMLKVRKRKQGRVELDSHPVYRDLQARIAFNLRRLRNAKEWTQEDAAEESKLAVPLYQRAEASGQAKSNQSNLTLTTLARLCAGFNVDVRELFRPARAQKKTGAGQV